MTQMKYSAPIKTIDTIASKRHSQCIYDDQSLKGLPLYEHFNSGESIKLQNMNNVNSQLQHDFSEIIPHKFIKLETNINQENILCRAMNDTETKLIDSFETSNLSLTELNKKISNLRKQSNTNVHTFQICDSQSIKQIHSKSIKSETIVSTSDTFKNNFTAIKLKIKEPTKFSITDILDCQLNSLDLSQDKAQNNFYDNYGKISSLQVSKTTFQKLKNRRKCNFPNKYKGVISFKRSICDKLRQASNVKMEKYNQINYKYMFKCQSCLFFHKNKDSLVQHINENQACMTFKCSFCTHFLYGKANIKYHLHKKHSEIFMHDYDKISEKIQNMQLTKKSEFNFQECYVFSKNGRLAYSILPMNNDKTHKEALNCHIQQHNLSDDCILDKTKNNLCPQPYQCFKCNYASNLLIQIVEHLCTNKKCVKSTIVECNRYLCSYCPFKCYYSKKMDTHFLKCHANSEFKFESIEEYVTYSPTVLLKGYLAHLFITNFENDSPVKKYQSYECLICNQNLYNFADNHLYVMHKKYRYECKLCSFGEWKKWKIYLHLENVHSSVRESGIYRKFAEKNFIDNLNVKMINFNSLNVANVLVNSKTKSFTNLKHQNSHLGYLKKFNNFYTCTMCGYRGFDKNAMEIHCNSHIRFLSRYRCHLCPYFVDDSVELLLHLNVHSTTQKDNFRVFNKHPKQIYYCTKCPYDTKMKDTFYKHLQFHVKRENFVKCTLCDYWVSRKRHLVQHFAVHSSDYKNKRIQDSSVLNDGMDSTDLSILNGQENENKKINEIINFKKKVYPYPPNKEFNVRMKLINDNIDHLNNFAKKHYLYTMKNNTLENLIDATVQRQKHSLVDSKMYTCSKCPYLCFNNYGFIKHISCHNAKKSNSCTICDYSCEEANLISLHMKIHQTKQD